MTARPRAPRRDDIVWIDLSPQAGHEQAGRRPALVVSPHAYNAASGLALVCPITSRAKGYPFEVVLPPGLGIDGVVLADHLRSVDWRARRAERACAAPSDVTADVLAKLAPLVTS